MDATKHLTPEQFISEMAEIFDVLARWDFEEKKKSEVDKDLLASAPRGSLPVSD